MWWWWWWRWWCVVVVLSAVLGRSQAYSSTYSASGFSKNVTNLLDSLLANYDRRIRPRHGGEYSVPGAMQRDATQPLYLDLHLPPDSHFEQELPAAHNAFVYVYRGSVGIAGQVVPDRRMAVLSNEAETDGVVIEAAADGPARALLIAGQPLREPIVQHGPFVMNTQEEIYQALSDYRSGRLGEAASPYG